MNCHRTAPSFTVSLEPVDFVTLCPLIPGTQPYMTFLFVGSQFCAQASFPQSLTELQLPSASSYTRLNIKQARFSYRGLSPHKFMPMLGVHKCVKSDAAQSPAAFSWQQWRTSFMDIAKSVGRAPYASVSPHTNIATRI